MLQESRSQEIKGSAIDAWEGDEINRPLPLFEEVFAEPRSSTKFKLTKPVDLIELSPVSFEILEAVITAAWFSVSETISGMPF
jgi:hypothetical protein